MKIRAAARGRPVNPSRDGTCLLPLTHTRVAYMAPHPIQVHDLGQGERQWPNGVDFENGECHFRAAL